LGPLRTGFFYGSIAAAVALLTDLRFLLVDPQSMPDWMLAALEGFRTQFALACYFFLGILAALRVRPARGDPEATYRSLLVRDCALAATVVAVVVGCVLLLLSTLNATLFADEIRVYARDAAPSIAAYDEKVAGRLDDPPPLPTVGEIERSLQPPALWDLGRSITNFVLRALVLGTSGALVGFLRGRSAAAAENGKPRVE
jgi:hypothetical protein